MRFLQEGFRTSTHTKKSARLGPHSGSELSADFTSSTPPTHVAHVDPGMWRDEAGFVWVQMCSSRGTGWTTQQCTVMNLGDEFLGIYSFFLVAGRRWYWRVRLSGLPFYSEPSRAAAGFRLFHAHRCATTGAGVELSSSPSPCVSLR